MKWQIRMLGRFEVLGTSGRPVAFRSRKVGALLAFLALHRGRALSSHTLQDLLWPDVDGDRQSQSLRRAIADLRDAFEEDSGRRDLVRTDHGLTSLDDELFESDVVRFETLLSESAAEEFDLHAAEALALYGGPLLASLDDDWVFAYRRQIEEMYCRAVESLCQLLSNRGQGREAVRIANAAILLAPQREEVYIASIQGYAAMGNRSMALQQYEALEKMLDDQFGQTPSEQALAAVDGPAIPYPGIPDATPKPISSVAESGGVNDVESRFYVVREADAQVDRALDTSEPVVLVFGPRQVGKTSLLARCCGRLRSSGARIVVADFQSLGKSEVERPATLYRALIHGFASQLGLTYEPSWNEWVGPNSNLDTHINDLLKQTDGPVVWAMDEVDRLFGTEFADDFFGLVRSWHNRRALDPEGPWKRLSLLISYATEAHLFIKDLNQSPFNIGVRVNLRDFTEEQVVELGNRYPSFVARWSQEAFEITRGHPFLTRRAFGFLEGKRTIEELRALAPTEEGPFGDHLKHVRETLLRDTELRNEVKRFLKGEKIANSGTQLRLTAAGLLSDSSETTVAFRVPAYERYLSSALA
ncbi:MAG TPA: AAA-like domain-containing protein [Fimbriimonadaceae bacterium]|nr:AAA-like domain-containing protein [Fimbriimonadaceae bacterium]